MGTRLLTAAAAACAITALTVAMPPHAVAAPGDGYATWTLSGSGGAYTASATDLAVGFPAVSVRSTSAAPATVGSGATAWIPAGTGFGTAFGSSQGRTYLGLRPAANNASSPSDTVLTFDAPTPVSGWGIALGDLEAETVEVFGRDVDGAAVTGAELGLVETFSFCDASPRSAACSGQTAPYAVPTATVLADRVTATDPRCPADPTTCDTVGETVWLSPTVPLSSLTVRSTWNQGLPSYQLWLATAEHAAAGTVLAPCGADGSGVTVEAVAPDDTVAATTTSATGGAWGLDRLLARPDWRVRVVAPAGTAVDGDATRTVDLSATDVTDLSTSLVAVRPVSGTVTDGAGSSLAGASVVLRSGTQTLGPLTTGADGGYTFPTVRAGSWQLVVTAPAGYTDAAPVDLTVGCAAVTVDPVALDPAATPTPTPTATPTATATSTPSTAPTTSPSLPGSGPTTPGPAALGPTALAQTGSGAALPLAGGGAGAVLVGAAVLAWSRRPARRH